ncbi:hypothetical protein QIA19_05665 (plasmid) [Borreliella finlandensis]|uniref:hypothetical protein n=1 Tax=Borreliella finlandensis TaxID=498741 RepID=UPI00264877A5|nr:hypothetical protein [Borreliella finlandensis]WKC89484.1 hypothetical protein QIA19_00205 [Borreliella finlandensis]
MLNDWKDSYEKLKKSFGINPGKYKNIFPFLKEANILTICGACINSNFVYNNFLDKLKKEAKRKDVLNIRVKNR